jgi:AraC-like DNA-binding protein
MKIAFEKVMAEHGSSFVCREKRERGFKGVYHFHPEVELTQIVQGSGHRFVGDNLSPFSDGDLVLLGANLPHRYTSAPGVPGWVRARVIQFSEDHFGAGVLSAPECAELTRLLERASRGLVFSGAAAHHADRRLARVFAAHGFERFVLLLELLHFLALSEEATPICSAGYVSKLNSFESDKVNQALDYLQKHLEADVDRDELAARLHVSPTTCNRLLQKSIGKSFKPLLLEMRLSHACKLLVETNAAIIRIAHQCGFANLSNFNRRFKKFSGTTPRRYRERLLKP